MRYVFFVCALATALAALPAGSAAWEATTTHAGLTEQAALRSQLHLRLRGQFGIEQGLFANLTVPPGDAPALFEALRKLNPTHGYVPDSRGRLSALGWLAAGSVVADMPPSHAANHFFDPTTGKGLSDATVRGLSARLRHGLNSRLARDSMVRSGMPAIDWITHTGNPMSAARFAEQYTKAVISQTPAERERHVAGALLAAGAMLHVLQDMGSPSHVRDDLAAHLDVVGNDDADVGSRFERIAALAYGRLGVPAPRATIERPSLRAFFTAEDRGGLADRTAVRWLSAYTLPRPIRIRPGTRSEVLGDLIAGSLAKPHPAPLPRLDFQSARESSGARLVNDDGVCVAGYQLRQGILSWYLEDECLAEQAAVILPEVTGYSAGLIDFAFRGTIDLERGDKQIRASAVGTDFGAGTLEIFWDDDRGVRTRYGKTVSIQQAQNGEVFAVLPKKLPKEARAVAALYRGVDKGGQPLLAAGYQSFAKKASAKPAK